MRNYLKRENRRRKRETVVVCVYFLITFIIALIFVSVIKVVTWEGHSMEPTLAESDTFLVSAVSLIEGNFEYGDLIAYKSKVASEDGSCELIKRIEGLPGDVIEIKNGVVFRNGISVKGKNHINEIVGLNMNKRIVQDNQLFVLSDDLTYCCDGDSFDLNFIYFEDVVGKAELRIFPLERFGLVE